MKKLHATQQKLLQLLERYQHEGYTIRELQEELGLSTPSLVHFHITQLEKKGYLQKNATNPADYRLLSNDTQSLVYLNIYGLARCGPNGTILSGEPEGRHAFSSEFFDLPLSRAFLVRAKGDSMLPRIADGDVVVFEQSNAATDGAIVACADRGAAYIKRLVRAGQRIMLYSLNEKYPPFEAEPESFRIEGIARMVIARV